MDKATEISTVIFDLDGTLTIRDTYVPFLMLCLKELGLRSFSVLLLPLYVFLYGAGIISNSRLKELFLRSVLSGISLKQLEPVTEKFIADLLQNGINRQLIDMLNDHLRKQHKVIMATASFDLYVMELARRFGIRHVVCTRSEIKDGIITGKILGNNCHGEEKAARVEKILQEKEWMTTLCYTDHHSDLPLLQKAKYGFLVNPGLKTYVVLKRFNFNVLRVT